MRQVDKSRRGRDSLKPAARRLAEMVCDTPGLTPDHYAAAGDVLRLVLARQGRKDMLSIEQQWELIDFLESHMRSGKSLDAASQAAVETSRWAVDVRTMQGIWRRVRKPEVHWESEQTRLARKK